MLIIHLENEGSVDKYDKSTIGLLECKKHVWNVI